MPNNTTDRDLVYLNLDAVVSRDERDLIERETQLWRSLAPEFIARSRAARKLWELADSWRLPDGALEDALEASGLSALCEIVTLMDTELGRWSPGTVPGIEDNDEAFDARFATLV